MTRRTESPAISVDAEDRVRRVEVVISSLLRAGVLASLALIVVGTLISFAHHPEYFSSPVDLGRLV
ncbi:MAG TPA: DUF1634 domain-containing protein, partial [Candidatus Binatia bacterium]